MAPRLQFLRPCTFPARAPCTIANSPAYLRFYELAKAHASRSSAKHRARGYANRSARDPALDEELSPAQSSARRTQRILELREADKLRYPGVTFFGQPTSTRAFRTRWEEVSRAELVATRSEISSLTGRVLHVRKHGSKFSFIVIVHDGRQLQIMMKHSEMSDGTDEQAFKEFHRFLQRGDQICKPTVATVV
jgi:lysyl-tRNA synthetase class II